MLKQNVEKFDLFFFGWKADSKICQLYLFIYYWNEKKEKRMIFEDLFYYFKI